ncbi:MAG TPA: ATP-dependent Clp protease ATP-binding subunit, partial [Terriglobales bacterium]
MKSGCQELLDPTLRCDDVCQFETALRRKIVGQDTAVACVVDLYQTFLAGLHPPGRPIANLLLLGPTGSGKTRVVEAVAET